MTIRVSMAVFALIALGCDSYDCSDQKCPNGDGYQSCLSCYDTQCTYQTRDKGDDVIEECDYESNGMAQNSERDACMSKAKAAACAR
jgi:hypothetical protein